MTFLFIPLMAALSRMAGGGLGADKLWKPLPELLFALCFAVVVYFNYGIYAAPFSLVIAYLGMQTGHGTAYHMGRAPELAIGRKQFLSRFIDPICEKFHVTVGSTLYCWAFMGLKGLIIGLALPPVGLLLAFLWPLSYEIGWRTKMKTELGEFLSGAAAGLVLSLGF